MVLGQLLKPSEIGCIDRGRLQYEIASCEMTLESFRDAKRKEGWIPSKDYESVVYYTTRLQTLEWVLSELFPLEPIMSKSFDEGCKVEQMKQDFLNQPIRYYDNDISE